MSRKTNIINNALTMIFMMIGLFFVVYACNSNYNKELIEVILWFFLGAVISGFINTVIHELAHLVVGKKNGFAFSSMVIWFFKWSKVKNKIRFDFTMFGEEAGYTEMIPKNSENIAIRYQKMSIAGPIASFFCMLIGIAPFFISTLPYQLFCLWSVFLPVGAYFFFGSVLPVSSNGFRNDGAVYYCMKKMDDVSKVTVNLLSIQAEMYCGKTPCEINENLYFDLPQLAEDNPVFAMLLNARYNYYLDKGDYDNAKKVTERLLSIEEYIPKSYLNVVKTDALYNACTFDYNEDIADDLVYELEKYLNNINTATNIRAKLSYLLYVKREKDSADVFYGKGIKEANRTLIKGYGNFERKLLEDMKKDIA